MQNFRAKPDTRMRDAPEPDLNELLWTVAVARLAFGPDMPVQCPPNLTPTPADSEKNGHRRDSEKKHHDRRASSWRALLNAGVSCFGGISPERVTPDHVSPELAWPSLVDLARATRDAGFALTPRLGAPRSYPPRSVSDVCPAGCSKQQGFESGGRMRVRVCVSRREPPSPDPRGAGRAGRVAGPVDS